MADKAELKRKLAEMRTALFAEGYLGDRFTQLENEHDGSISKIEEAINEFFEDTLPKILKKLDEKMNLPGLQMADEIAELTAKCQHIGAKKIENECEAIGKCVEDVDIKEFIRAYVLLTNEIDELEGKLKAYFQLAKQAKDED